MKSHNKNVIKKNSQTYSKAVIAAKAEVQYQNVKNLLSKLTVLVDDIHLERVYFLFPVISLSLMS